LLQISELYSKVDWWKKAVFYEVYIRSFQDSDGDGVGDIAGVTSRLDYFQELGVDSIWITPIFASPMQDHGYDVSNYRVIDPLFGSMVSVENLITEIHSRRIRILLDIVPNHTSREHKWFQEALSDDSRPGPRDRYIFRKGGANGSPPNNWQSVFGGSAWESYGDEYYLHLFAESQPDLNWRHADVTKEFEEILKFWISKNIDGFRIDVAHGLFKDRLLRDEPREIARVPGTDYQGLDQIMVFDQPEIHDLYRRWRTMTKELNSQFVLLGEVYLHDPMKAAKYGSPDELGLVLAFALTAITWNADEIVRVISQNIDAFAFSKATPAWVLDSHDVSRSATRFGGGYTGQRRSLCASVLLLSLPGACIIYQGQELSLEDGELSPEDRTDPIFRMSNGHLLGRDGCRIPLPWDNSSPANGFSTGKSWLPQEKNFSERSVEQQNLDTKSSLSIIRKAIKLRKDIPQMASGEFDSIKNDNGRIIICWKYEALKLICVFNITGEPIYMTSGKVIFETYSKNSHQDVGLFQIPQGEAAWILE